MDLSRILRFVQVLRSLKFAVLVIVMLAAAMAVGTFLESAYDTATARYWVYGATWFHVVLFLLGVNIFYVALSRYPWKRKHIPFLLAHLGILLLLSGGWITQRWGVDGLMAVEEGRSSSAVDLEGTTLYVGSGDQIRRVPIPWRPPGVKFEPITIPEYDLTIDQYLTHAEPKIEFQEAPTGKSDGVGAAVGLRVRGGPFQVRQDVWLWSGDLAWSSVPLGPARFYLFTDRQKNLPELEGPRVVMTVRSDGSLKYEIFSSRGRTASRVLKAGEIRGHRAQTGWMGMEVEWREWIPRAVNATHYAPSRTQYGLQAPGSAIHLRVGKGGEGAELWLGEDDRATLEILENEIQLAYQKKRVVLPFSLQLERFEIQHYQGSVSPMSYQSRVRVLGERAPEGPIVISMNEPLEWKGFTFYQSSYIPGEPRPTISVFTVNRDPGRWLKYIGSILIVWGSVLLFAARYSAARKTRRPDVAVLQPEVMKE